MKSILRAHIRDERVDPAPSQPRRRRPATRLGLLTVLAVTGATVVVNQPATAAAWSNLSGSCSASQSGQKKAEVRNSVNNKVVTHASGVSVAPYTSISQSTTLTYQNQVTTTITGNLGGSAEWNLAIVKLGGSAGVTLQSAGSNTSTSSVTTTLTFNNTTQSQLRFAGFRSVHKVTGEYAIYSCLASNAYPSGWAWTFRWSGNVGSWASHVTGTAKCPKSSYSTSSAEYKALNIVWGTSC